MYSPLPHADRFQIHLLVTLAENETEFISPRTRGLGGTAAGPEHRNFKQGILAS